MSHHRSAEQIAKLLTRKPIVTLPTMQKELAGASVMTVFRYLKQVPYRRSYNCNGRYYALHEVSRYDRFGLWTFSGAHFSVDGTLMQTVRRLVCEAPAGAWHKELQERLQIRVHNPLLHLVRRREIAREDVHGRYLYLHVDGAIQAAQLAKRREWIAAQTVQAALTDGTVIQVLLTLIRYPGAMPADVVRRLRGHDPPITLQHVRAVFDRYDLDAVGEKGGPSTC